MQKSIDKTFNKRVEIVVYHYVKQIKVRFKFINWVENTAYNDMFAFTDYNLKKFERFSKMYTLNTLDLLIWILDSTDRSHCIEA